MSELDKRSFTHHRNSEIGIHSGRGFPNEASARKQAVIDMQDHGITNASIIGQEPLIRQYCGLPSIVVLTNRL